MPKKTVRASANARKHATPTAPDPVQALIDKAARGTTKSAPPEVIDAVRRFVEHNDANSAPTKKVGADVAITVLQGLGWVGQSKSALDSLCRRALGRKSWGTP